MKSSSVIAIVVALGIGITTAAFSQVSVETSVAVSAEVSVDPSSVLSSVTSEVSSAVSSELSSVSSELSSMTSSEMSSSAMSSEMGAMSAEMVACSDLDASTLIGSPMDADALAAITSVTIFEVDDCSGLSVAMDPNAIAGFGTNQAVIDALAATGQTGSDIVAYSVDGTSLTIYVDSKN